MTDRTHLTDDVLLDLVDGRADDATRAHLAACAGCATTLADLRDAAQLVRAPVPPAAAEHRAAAIAAAVDLHDRLHRDRAAPSRRTSRTAVGRRRATLAVAAAAIAVVAASVVAFGGDDEREQVATRPPASSDAVADSGAGSAAAGGTAGAVAGDTMMASAPDDLGALDERALRDRVTERLAAARSAAPRSAASAEGAAPATPPPAAACDAERRASDATLPAPAVVAFATWSGTPAVVLAYRVGGGRDVVVYVTAREGCATLHELRFRTAS